ncbi:MAG: sigma 54-interacting transcriptional regulator [Planctomycetota bacterium]|nr:sigma 54-interacting transcriptional regulator [Planctomycetota bacterium]
MVRADDVLELLLPGADAATLRHARGVTQFLRLLCDDARRSRAPAVGLDVGRACGVLDEHARAALERALGDLLRHHLVAVQPVDSFLWAGDAELDVAAAWREIELARAEFTGLPELPHPGEPAAASGARVLAALEALAPEPQAALWRARWVQATAGARAAETLFRELAASARRPRPGVLVQRAAIAGVAECLLERGAVREARAWLGEHALQISVDPRLRQLFAWTRLALADVAGARAVLQGLKPWSGPIPRALCELRDVHPDWLACLAGRGDPAWERARAGHVAETGRPDAGDDDACVDDARGPRVRGRTDCGASAIVALAFRPGRGIEVLHFDAAPALAGRREAWHAEREGSNAVSGEREQIVLARAAPLVEHAEPGQVLRGALGGSATRSLAVVPILDDDGEVAGWVQCEFEHHLVPSRARLAALAVTWRRAALAARARVGADAESDLPAPRTPPRALTLAFEELVEDLGLKTILRRWSGFSVADGEPVPVAQGGEGQGFGNFAPGRGRALARALTTGGRIDFEAPDERLSVHARAASGVVLPLRFEGSIRGLLAVESSRRRDFQGVDLEAWSERADAASSGLLIAQFCAWHREHFAFEPWFDPRTEDFRAFARRLVQAARSRAPVTISGPAGVGKLVLARWLHYESEARGGPFVVLRCSAPAERAEWTRLLGRAAGGSLVLDDVEALDAAWQELLLGELEGPASGEPGRAARIVATTRGLDARAADGGFRADLALRLERVRLRVPALAERRAEIPGLADALAQRFAAEEGVLSPRLADDAHGLLWRQPWPGNVRELENLVYNLVLAHPGIELSAEDVGRVAVDCGLVLARRIPTRHPRRSDLLAALRSTRTAGSRSNKTRAARYLGWDPDTLVARLADAGLTDQVVDTAVWSEERASGKDGRDAIRSGTGASARSSEAGGPSSGSAQGAVPRVATPETAPESSPPTSG